jgi:hypothetical protein
MRLTELTRSRQWPSAAVEDGLTGLLAPTPVVVDGELFLVVGRRSPTGSSSLWALRVRGDLGDAELLPLSLDGQLPEYCRDGLVPTDARCNGGRRITVLFSGFRMIGERYYQLLTGSASGELQSPLQVESRPLLPSLPGQSSLRASATFSRVDSSSLLYAAGEGWVELHGRSHPTSHLRRKPLDPHMHPGEVVLRPAEEEFALTRPVDMDVDGQSLLFFSRRMHDGRYLQGFARGGPDTPLVRCDEEFWAGVGTEDAYMYAYPFSWQGRLLLALATSRVGDGGVVLAEVEDIA